MPDKLNNLNFDQAFDGFQFYENAANTIKGRTWTISAWILTVNSGIFAFVYNLFKENTVGSPILLVAIAACIAGITLCWFLLVFVIDQGGHLQWYWAQQRLAAISDPDLQTLTQTHTDDQEDIDDWMSKLLSWVSREQRERQQRTGKPFPTFCRRITLLAFIYAVGFAGTLAYCLYQLK